MKLPDHCPFATIAATEFPLSEIDRPDCCRTVTRIWLPEGEEPLCRSRQTEDEAYRFSWDSSFNGHAVVHIGRKDDSIMLRSHTFAVPGSIGAPRNVALCPADWEKLQHALDAAHFWSLGLGCDLPKGFDGADWMIEGHRGDTYNVLRDWSPRGAVYDLGLVFFVLAGTLLAGVELY